MVKNFEEKFKELCVEGHCKELNSPTSVMFAKEDEYMDEDDVEIEKEEDLDASKGDLDSLGEIEEKEMYYMGTQSQARKRFNKTNNFQTNTFRSRNPYKNTFIRCQVWPPYYTQKS